LKGWGCKALAGSRSDAGDTGSRAGAQWTRSRRRR